MESLLYEFSRWRTDSSVVRHIAVAAPVAGEAVWTLNHLPAAAVAYLLWRKRSKRGVLQSGCLRGGWLRGDPAMAPSRAGRRSRSPAALC